MDALSRLGNYDPAEHVVRDVTDPELQRVRSGSESIPARGA
jgi:hypothetical protein